MGDVAKFAIGILLGSAAALGGYVGATKVVDIRTQYVERDVERMHARLEIVEKREILQLRDRLEAVERAIARARGQP